MLKEQGPELVAHLVVDYQLLLDKGQKSHISLTTSMSMSGRVNSFFCFFLILKFCFLSLSLPLLSCFSSLLAVIQVGEKRLSDFGATQKRAEGSKKKKRERKKEKKEGRYVRIQASIIQVGD